MRFALRVFGPALVLALLGLLPARAAPADAFRLEARIPASTLAFASIENVSSWAGRIGDTAIGKLMADPEMQAFLKPIRVKGEQALHKAIRQVPPMVLDLIENLKGVTGQVAVALVDADIQAHKVSLALSADFGGHLDSFVDFLEKARTQLDPNGGHVTVTQKDGRKEWTIDAGVMSIYATYLDTTFLATTDKDLLDAILAGGKGTLAEDQEFQTVRGRAGGDDLGVFVFANVQQALSQFGHMIPRKARHIANAFGLDTVRSVAYGMAFSGDGFQDTLMVHAPKADHGLIPLLHMAPLKNPQTLALAPAGTFYWAEANLPFDEVLTNVRTLAKGVDPDAVDEIDGGLAMVDQMLGVDLEKDVLGGLAGPYGLYAALTPTGGLYPEVAAMFQVKDPAGYEGVFDKLSRGIAGLVSEETGVAASTRTMKYHDQTLHLFEMHATHGREPIPFTPTWAILGDKLVVTLVPNAMKEIVLRQQGEQTAGLSSKSDFQALWKQKPDDAGGMAYLDLKSALTLLYGTGAPLAQTLLKPNVMKDVPIQIDWAALPPSSRVAPYLRSLGEYVTWNEDGVVFSYHAPIPIMPIAVGIGAAVGFMSARHSMSMMRTRHEAVEVEPVKPPSEEEPTEPEAPDVEGQMDVELANIQAEMIAEAAAYYHMQHNTWPDSIETLVKEGLMAQVPNDPWGGQFRFHVEGNKITVGSAGPDKQFGTKDDVTAQK